MFPVLDDGSITEFSHGSAAFVGIIVITEESCFFAVCKYYVAVILDYREIIPFSFAISIAFVTALCWGFVSHM